ncbi:MAG TPA: choice-of-anchor Q domain-containing protein [Pyrinomonadaceae bacterium]|nr:choice-of-anchor Q domain-containing protein [Pyrinomonadaceae bacterium]
MKTFLRTVLIVLAAFTFSAAVNAATFVVNTTADTVDAAPGDGVCADAGSACSLRAAIGEANALAGNDTITIPAGDYTQTLVAANEDANAGGDWDITSNITINGAGAATTNLQANAAAGAATERVIDVRAGSTTAINNVTVRNGRFSGTMTAATRGGGIQNLGSLTLNGVIVRDNQLSSTSANPIGAGVYNAGPTLTLLNTTVTANSNVRVTGGSAFGGGVASIVAAAITVTDSNISGNSATSQAGGFGFGAGLYLESIFNVNATNSHFDGNTGSGTSGTNGTGVRALSSAGAAVFSATNCTFSNNSGIPTGAPLHQGVGLQFFTSTAAIGTLTVTLDRVTVDGNAGNSVGVGINATVVGGNMNFSMLNSTLSNNRGGTNGGGMLVSNNGGLASSTGTFNFTNSTFSGNTATANGGAYAVEQPVAAATITTNFNFATIANNIANFDNLGTEGGGGIIRASGTVNLKNSVVGDNSVGAGGTSPDILGTVNSQDYNHVEDITGTVFTGVTTNNVTGVDAGLGALAPNGGPTQTHLPGAGSLVINAIPSGTNDCGTAITSDQRGTTRPGAGACEKGSVEIAAVAGNFDVGGRITTPGGSGIRNVAVIISGGSLPQPLVAQTGSFGYFIFHDVPSGTYTLSVSGKRYTFTPSSRSINLTSDLTNENFTADPTPGIIATESFTK